MNPVESEVMTCKKRVKFGYARVRHIRLYGEKSHLLSNAFPDCDGFAIEGMDGTSRKPRRVRVPLSVVQMLRHEVALREDSEIAAWNLC